MAITNHQRVGQALDLLKDGLRPFVERELKSVYQHEWFSEAQATLSQSQLSFIGNEKEPKWDIASILAVIWNQWEPVFKKTLGRAERSIVSELREARNRWAHQTPFSTDDSYRALDSVVRLLNAVSAANQADEVEKMKMELLRTRFDEQVRTERRRMDVVSTSVQGLKPWREVIDPHPDVATGRYQQAEFAADLWLVFMGKAPDEYQKPSEFFRRTFLTDSLKGLLKGALQRLSGNGGDPVVQLQTNFGGGKTHSMLALYHLFSGAKAADLLGVESLLGEVGLDKIPTARKPVVLVGNKISPGNPVTKSDGTVIRTLWGELAWQLGGKAAFGRIKADDEKGTNPGDVLRELFEEYGPCLVLIDEWVAYARQLHEQKDLPGGTFETHFTFAQSLTEAAKAPKTLLVISLPASTRPDESPHTQTEDVEVGGERGRQALEGLRNAVGRVEATWRPATGEESFEIVRRRLFQEISADNKVHRDNTAKAFAEFYRKEKQEFPSECSSGDYEKRLRAAYPIHPELFDRLYTDWSTLVKFQRTRGVLRLMACVIHSLYSRDDRNPLIMPGNIPIDDPRVQPELTHRYLSENWVPIIERDIDGPNSLPVLLDGKNLNLGRISACRRVARVIYMGSAPISKAANKGLDDRHIKLGCAMPGEGLPIFGDALRVLSREATYLYHDNARYWYDTQPTVTKLAEDRAGQLKGDPATVAEEIKRRVQEDVKTRGDFYRIHAFPPTSGDVPDEMEARLVVFGIEYSHVKEVSSPALAAAKAFLESRGSSPRLCKNTLVFLAVDKPKLQDLDDAARRFLAWDSIVREAATADGLNLDPNQQRQARVQRDSAESALVARLPEAYQWLIVPTQETTQAAITFEAVRLQGQEPLAARASKLLKQREELLPLLASTELASIMEKVPLWRGNHVPIKQLFEDFVRYLYLPRLKEPQVLATSIAEGLGTLLWEQDTLPMLTVLMKQQGVIAV